MVSVSGNPWLAGSLALGAGAVAAGYAVRAASSLTPVLPGLVALAFSLLMVLWLLAALDARLPRLVMDRQGLRLRFGRTWAGIPWADLGDVTIRVRRGLWWDDVLVPTGAGLGAGEWDHLSRMARWQAAWARRCFGSPYAVPVGWSTRVQGADGDLLRALSELQIAPKAQTSRTAPRLPVPGTLWARLRDPRPRLAAGITLGANALQLNPANRRAVLPEAAFLQRIEPDFVDFVDHAPEPTHVIAVPSEADAPRPDPAIGSALAKARLSFALTVPQLAERARIPARVIEAIESGDFATSGGDFHARSQLQTLCRVLGVQPGPLLAAYDTELVAPDPVGREALLATLARQREASTGARARRWSLAAGVLLVVTLGWSLVQLDQPAGPEIEQPASPSLPVQP